MLERAGARFWVSIVAGAIAFPVAAVVLLAVVIIRAQIAGPVLTDPAAVTVAAAPPISSLQKKIEAAEPPQRVAATEPVAPPTTAPSPEPASVVPMPDNASPAEVDRAQAALPKAALPQAAPPQDPPPQAAVPQEAPPQDASPSVSPIVTAKPAVPESAALEPAKSDTGAASVPTQVEAAKSLPAEEVAKALPPETVGERFAPALETKAPDFTPALSVFATFAAVPPKLGTAYADPTRDGSTKPAPPTLSEPISGPVPLPRPKPRVAANHPVAPVNASNVSRVPPSPLPVGSSSPPRTAPAPR